MTDVPRVLQTLQRQFLRYILTGDAADIFSRLAPSLNETHALGQLAVYGKGYRLRLANVLTDIFPMTKRLIGERLFEQWVNQYLDTLRSDHIAIEWIAEGFIPFLSSQNSPLFKDLAQIEWRVEQALSKPIVSALSFATFSQQAAIGLDDCQFLWQPSLTWLTLDSNAMRVWRSGVLGEPLPPLQSSERQYGLLWLQHIYPTLRESSVLEQQMIEQSRQGATLSEIVEARCEHEDEAQAIAHCSQFLQQWLKEGLLMGLQPV